MKTSMKKMAIALVMILTFCSGVNAQDGIYFDTGTTLTTRYRDTKILGAAGDTLVMKCEINDTLREVIWYVEGTAVDTTDTFLFVLGDTLGNPSSITVAYAIDPINPLEPTTDIWTKFSSPEYNYTQLTGGKSTNDTLTLSNFNINHHTSSPKCRAFCDSIFWFRNNILIHAGNDTSYVTTINGDYHIKIKNIYMNIDGYPIADTVITVRFETSEKITINDIDTHVEGFTQNEEYNNNINIYPIPTTDYLNISETIDYVVFSITGQEILKGFGNKIDVTYFEKGVYILKTTKGINKFIVK